MPRGFETCQYWDDDGTPWRLQVDSDYANMADRGWEIALTPGLYPLPRGWEPRGVWGMDDTGRMFFARVARLDARLWTGAARTFIAYDSNRDLRICDVIRFEGEFRRH